MSITHARTLAVLALTATLVVHAACGGTPGEDAATVTAPLDVETTVVQRAMLPQTFEAGGLVQAALTATVASRLLADVRTVHVVAGDQVRRGQVLVTLDARDLTAARAQADASVAAVSQARLAAEAERAAAEAARDLADATLARIEGLHAQRAATTQELDQARATAASARAQLAAVEARLTGATAGITAAEAARESATIGLSHATLRAPFDGVVSDISVDPGSQVGPGTPVARVDSPGRRVDVSVDAARAAGLEIGHAAQVWLDDRAEPLAGEIVEIAHTVEAGLQSVTLKVALAPDAAVPTGRFARVRIAGAAREAVAVPNTALFRRGQLTGVFVVDADQRARLRLVSSGLDVDGQTEILAGVEAGETVLTAPPAHLVDGTLVTPKGGRP